MPARVWTDREASLRHLENKTVAVLGFGSQGHAHALNLKDSGCTVLVGLPPGSQSIRAARKLGFRVLPNAQAVRRADVILLAMPDTKQAPAYDLDIAPNLVPGQTLVFCHGFAIHYRTIVPHKHVDVILVAPKGPGPLLRRLYTEGKGLPALIALHQNPSGQALQTALAYAKGIGATRAGVIRTTFKQETETDLFGEQTVLCGGLTALVRAAFETLVEAGYQPELAYFECLHELGLTADLLHRGGISGMRRAISETAKWGDITVGPEIIRGNVKKRMQATLRRIQSGRFAKAWIAEYQGGYRRYRRLLAQAEKHPVEKVGARLRRLMPWLTQQP